MSGYPRKRLTAKDWLILGKHESHIQRVIHSIAQQASEAEKLENDNSTENTRSVGVGSDCEKHVRFNLPSEREPEPELMTGDKSSSSSQHEPEPFDVCEHAKEILSKWKDERTILSNDLSVLNSWKAKEKAVFQRRAKLEAIKHAAQEKRRHMEHFVFMSQVQEELERKVEEFEQEECEEIAKKKIEGTELEKNLTEKFKRDFKYLYERPSQLLPLEDFATKIKIGEDANKTYAKVKNETDTEHLDYFKVPEPRF